MREHKAYLIGGGIASLAAAAYLIRDGHWDGRHIFIFDESSRFGGSLDAQDLEHSDGYVMRGIRMFEEQTFTSTLDLMSFIPSLARPDKTIYDEFVEYNRRHSINSKSRLIKNAKPIDPRPLGLNAGDRLRLAQLLFTEEKYLDGKSIRDHFSGSFFQSRFWLEFSTVYSFQPWHSLTEFKRYNIRFIHDFPIIDTLKTVEITPYNQYESLILPIVSWLKGRGVNLMGHTRVRDLEFSTTDDFMHPRALLAVQNGQNIRIKIEPNSIVMITPGCMTANSYIGSMDRPMLFDHKTKAAAWELWENLAAKNKAFGRPETFNSSPETSKWVSFTLTLRDPLFFKLMEKYTDHRYGTYGGISITDSNWLLSLLVCYKPYFLNQPQNVNVAWGYGLYPDQKGNFINKKMHECTGREIMAELIRHLGFAKHMDRLLETSTCKPCLMPYITSQFMPRAQGDRPLTVPPGTRNLALLGQFTEIPEDVVFTVEYSVRSAQTAVYSLLGLNKKPSSVYHGTHNLKVMAEAFLTLFR